MNKIIQGDCLEKLKELEDNSVDAVVTDPPYGLSFMGKKWDYDVPTTELWAECLRVLKPGGYLLSFAGTRTQHRMAVRIEDAGFEIRDLIFYTYGSGFPKSCNIFKQLKKQCKCGIMDEYERTKEIPKSLLRLMSETDISQTIPNQQTKGEVLQSGLSEQNISNEGLLSEQTPLSERRDEPSLERGNTTKENSRELSGNDLCEMSDGISTDGEERRLHNATQISNGSTPEQVIDENGSSASHRPQSNEQQDREPCDFCKQYFTQAVGAFGWGSALKPACEPISVCRKPISEKNLALNYLKWGVGGINIDGCRVEITDTKNGFRPNSANKQYTPTDSFAGGRITEQHPQGRFPANLIHDGSDEVVSLFPNTKGNASPRTNSGKGNTCYGEYETVTTQNNAWGDSGSASRFFYCAKASKSERNKGCEELEEKISPKAGSGLLNEKGEEKFSESKMRNSHPTVKPIALMEYLVKLVSREGAVVLDPFAGSGSTLLACKNLNRQYIGIEREADYIKIIEARLYGLKS